MLAESTAVITALSEAVPALADKNTVWLTRKLQLTPASATVQVAVSAPATALVVTLTYLVCKRPCSAHLIKSELDGISAPTKRKKDAIERLP